jgi:hypothetical protein
MSIFREMFDLKDVFEGIGKGFEIVLGLLFILFGIISLIALPLCIKFLWHVLTN